MIDEYRVFIPQQMNYPLTHFTEDFETLERIICEGFKPSYCNETITNDKSRIDAAFPMISFSNLSLNEAILVLSSYGTNGIALKNSWGQENKLNPVLYLERNSELTEQILYSINEHCKNQSSIHNALLKNNETPKLALVKTLINLFMYSKNYSGKLERGIYSNNNHIFGNEKEWRYVIKDNRFPVFIYGEGLEKNQSIIKELKTYVSSLIYQMLKTLL